MRKIGMVFMLLLFFLSSTAWADPAPKLTLLYTANVYSNYLPCPG